MFLVLLIVFFTLKLNDCVEYTCSRELVDKTDNCTISDKQPTGKILSLIRLHFVELCVGQIKKRIHTYIQMMVTTSNNHSQPVVPKSYPQPGKFWQACY